MSVDIVHCRRGNEAKAGIDGAAVLILHSCISPLFLRQSELLAQTFHSETFDANKGQ
jgi:hypothetical protein